MNDRRFPASVFRVGKEPDVRFTLANERTFLAWIRTALALIAGGLALRLFGLDLHPGISMCASMWLVGTGMILPLLAWNDWARAERALRRETPLPKSFLGILLAISVAGSGVLIMLAIFYR